MSTGHGIEESVKQSAPFGKLPAGLTDPIDVEVVVEKALCTDYLTRRECASAWQRYFESMESRVKLLWHPPVSKEVQSSEVEFWVNPDGTISKSRVVFSPPLHRVDAIALNAVRKATPSTPYHTILFGR